MRYLLATLALVSLAALVHFTTPSAATAVKGPSILKVAPQIPFEAAVPVTARPGDRAQALADYPWAAQGTAGTVIEVDQEGWLLINWDKPRFNCTQAWICWPKHQFTLNGQEPVPITQNQY